MFTLKLDIKPGDISWFFINDPKLVKMALFDDELVYLWKHSMFPKNNSNWVGVEAYKDIICLFRWEPYTKDTATIHIYLQSRYHNKKYLGEIKPLLEDYLVRNTNLRKIYAVFPKECYHVERSCKSLQFEHEGTFKEFGIWRNKITDFFIYGYKLKRD